MLIPDSKMTGEYQGINGCYWSDNDEDGCVVNWGRRTMTCPHLLGVKYKGKYYDICSPEFQSSFHGEDIDFSKFSWDCGYKEQRKKVQETLDFFKKQSKKENEQRQSKRPYRC